MSYSKLQLKPLQHKRQLSMSIRPRFHELLTNHKKQFRRKQEENIYHFPRILLENGKDANDSSSDSDPEEQQKRLLVKKDMISILRSDKVENKINSYIFPNLVRNKSNIVKENKNNSSVNYFKLSQTAGYFTSDGEVTNFITFPYKASISDYYYTSYNSNNTSTDFFTPEGTKKGTITQPGFPMIIEDRIFVFLPGGSSFVKCKEDGSKDWEYDSTCPITAFYSAKNALVAGYADGTIVHFTNEGDIIQNFQPGGSDYPVILAAALSNDGSYIASVSGQNRQRFVLAKKEGAQTKIVFHEYFPTNTKVQ